MPPIPDKAHFSWVKNLKNASSINNITRANNQYMTQEPNAVESKAVGDQILETI